MDEQVIKFILVAVIALLASYIQSTAGFGFGIFAMIFLPQILKYTEANVLSSILSSFTSLFVVFLMFRKIHWKNTVFPLIGCFISTYASVLFIKAQSPKILILLLGAALFALSLYFFFFSDKIRIKPTWYAGLIAGIISGILGGMFAIGGPPVVIYYMQSEEDSESYMATISAYFVLAGVVSIGYKAAAGFVTPSVWIGIAVGMLGMLVGSLVGKRTRDMIKPQMVKKIVYGFMAVSGIINIVTSLI